MKLGVFVPLLLGPLAELALGFELQPIQGFLPDHGKRSDKEDEFAALKLLSTESFFWAGTFPSTFQTEVNSGLLN